MLRKLDAFDTGLGPNWTGSGQSGPKIGLHKATRDDVYRAINRAYESSRYPFSIEPLLKRELVQV